MTLARLIEAVENGQWDHTVAWKVFGIGKTGQAERAFNGSLDAAKRLHDALLPEWGWEINVLSARLENAQGDVAYGQRIDGPQSRLWLLAILRAMEGRDG